MAMKSSSVCALEPEKITKKQSGNSIVGHPVAIIGNKTLEKRFRYAHAFWEITIGLFFL